MLIAANASSFYSEGKTAFEIMVYLKEKSIAVRSMSDRLEFASPDYLRLCFEEKEKIILAPETSPRIRTRVFRKHLREEAFVKVISSATRAGINHVQLYIILAVPKISPLVVDFLPDGFPGEQLEDVQYIAELATSIVDRMLQARPEHTPSVTIDCMPFVPAIGTSLQRASFPTYQTYSSRLELLESLINEEYRGIIKVTAAMDEITHFLQAFLERNTADAGLILWDVWRRSPINTWRIENLNKAVRESGYNLPEIYEEFQNKPLPYEGMIVEDIDGKTSCSA